MTPASVKTQVLIDGARNYVVRLSAGQDGTGIQLLNLKVVDVAGMNPPAGSHFKVMCIDAQVLGGIVELAWESGDPVNPVPFARLQLAEDHDYRRFGGQSTKGVPNATGSIYLSTLGFDIGSSFDLTLECIKGVGNPRG